MNYIRLFLFIVLLFCFLELSAQPKSYKKGKQVQPLLQSLKGQWQSEDDKNVILDFKKKYYIEMYNKDKTDSSNYVLSYSCVLKDSIRTNIYNLDKNIYLLFYKENKVEQCNELMNISNNILSWMNSNNGKMLIYKRMKGTK